MTEAVIVICPNPKCRREIEEPILLTVLSVTPLKRYEACPYCFAKLKPEPTVEQNNVPEATLEEEETTVLEEEDEIEENLSANGVLEKVKVSAPDFLKKVKALLPTSNGDRNEPEEKTDEADAELAVKKETVTEEETEEDAFELKDEPEEPTETNSSDEEETAKEDSEPEESSKKEAASGCPETFGYLASRPSDAPIPPQCLLCPKIVNCMLRPKE